MIVERFMSPRWLSNTWLLADRPGGSAVLIDSGGPLAPVLARLEELRLRPSHILCTHHHHDHVAHNPELHQRLGCLRCGGLAERELFGPLEQTLSGEEEIRVGDLCVRVLAIPGHTRGQLAFLANEERVFTGDTLFRGSVGGTRAPGHGSLEELRHSVLEVLLSLPPATEVHPGHMESTTIGRELRENPFVRLWRGLDPPSGAVCTALGEPATLLLRAQDYDGGTKCLVRFSDGREDVVPGSRVH
jgi:hydroxyacylglutathione hydrolase